MIPIALALMLMQQPVICGTSAQPPLDKNCSSIAITSPGVVSVGAEPPEFKILECAPGAHVENPPAYRSGNGIVYPPSICVNDVMLAKLSELMQQIDKRPPCTPAITGKIMEGTRCNGELWVTVPEPQLTLRCGKYQHLVPDHFENCSTVLIGCWEHIPDRCADDLHTVTEREWQELQERLKKLESK
jgi:hypothetical protein